MHIFKINDDDNNNNNNDNESFVESSSFIDFILNLSISNQIQNENYYKNVHENEEKTLNVETSNQSSSIKHYQLLNNNNNKLIINKGKCIILNFELLEWHHIMEKIEDKIVVDIKLLEDTFSHLGFAVESYQDFTYKQMSELIEQGGQIYSLKI